MTASIEAWRSRAERAESALHEIQMKQVRAEIAEREQLQQAEDERRTAERAAAESVALESERVNSWYNFRVEQSQKSDEAFAEFLTGDISRHRRDIPEGIWPEGVTPEAARAAAVVEEQADERGNLAETALGKLLIRAGVRQGRVSHTIDRDRYRPQ